MKICLSVLLLLMTSACASMPVSTMLKMRNFSPIEADPRNIQIAVRMPDTFGIREDGVKISLGAQRADLNEKLQEVFILESTEKIKSTFLLTQQKKGFTIRTFWIDVDDWQRLRQAQAKIQNWKRESGESTTGSFSIGAEGCRSNNNSLPQKIFMTTYIKFSMDEDFVVFTKDQDLRKQVDAQGIEEVLPPCSLFN